jgi:hypothetical protein
MLGFAVGLCGVCYVPDNVYIRERDRQREKEKEGRRGSTHDRDYINQNVLQKIGCSAFITPSI